MIDCSKAVNYVKEKPRMTNSCRIRCDECPLSMSKNGADNKMTCDDFEKRYPEKAVEIVQKWSDAHPRKTYLTEFLKNYPSALLNDDGIPESVCPYDLGLMNKEFCRKTCIECWNQSVKDGEE